MPYDFIKEYLKDPEIGERKLVYRSHIHKDLQTHEGVHDVEHVLHSHTKAIMIPTDEWQVVTYE